MMRIADLPSFDGRRERETVGTHPPAKEQVTIGGIRLGGDFFNIFPEAN